MKKYLSLLVLLSSFQVLAHELQVNVTLSPAGNFEAKNVKLRGDIKTAGGKYAAEQLWIKIDDFKTGIDLRDEHFKKHFNLQKFPKITLSNILAENGSGKGVLNVNGVDKNVTFNYKKEGDKKIVATFKVKNSDFKLPNANYMGIGVNDDVEIIATMDL